MKINIVDYIGIHCGMHYYNEAFEKTIKKIDDVEVSILSNYSVDNKTRPFLIHQYKGILVVKILKLLCNLLRLFFKVLFNRKQTYIYLTYGNNIDIIFMLIISMASKNIIDIHEAIGLSIDSNKCLKALFKWLYSKKIKSAIVHSDRTLDFLNEYGYKGEILKVPHFKYCFKKDCDLSLVGKDALSAISKDKINILFFGNISHVKGVDIYVDAINKLDTQYQSKINAIVAGKNVDNSINSTEPINPEIFNLIIRHITDDELVYFYQNCDYVAMPYRKTSQSGILEMAFYFQKPIIANDVKYFRQTLSMFPSFGLLSKGLDSDNYAKLLMSVIDNHNSNTYFIADQYDKFTNRKEIDDFINEFSAWLNK